MNTETEPLLTGNPETKEMHTWIPEPVDPVAVAELLEEGALALRHPEIIERRTLTMLALCAKCSTATEHPIWIKVKVWRVDLKAWRKESVPVCEGCKP